MRPVLKAGRLLPAAINGPADERFQLLDCLGERRQVATAIRAFTEQEVGRGNRIGPFKSGSPGRPRSPVKVIEYSEQLW